VATVKFANDDAATETIKRFTNKIKKLTGNNKCVKGNYTVPADTADFGPTIEKIRNSGAQAVFLAMNPTMAQTFLEQAMALELNGILWLGGRSWNDEKFHEFIMKNPQLEAAYSSDFGYDITTHKSAELLEIYRTKFGPDAVPDEGTAVGFDAYLLALQAIETAQETVMATTVEDLAVKYQTEAALKAATEELIAAQETGVPSGRHIKMVLSGIKNFEGASGFISFNGKNEATKTITIHHYRDGVEIGHYHVD
jgi:branched-chain amino acid transport system substrate-binding protein